MGALAEKLIRQRRPRCRHVPHVGCIQLMKRAAGAWVTSVRTWRHVVATSDRRWFLIPAVAACTAGHVHGRAVRTVCAAPSVPVGSATPAHAFVARGSDPGAASGPIVPCTGVHGMRSWVRTAVDDYSATATAEAAARTRAAMSGAGLTETPSGGAPAPAPASTVSQAVTPSGAVAESAADTVATADERAGASASAGASAGAGAGAGAGASTGAGAGTGPSSSSDGSGGGDTASGAPLPANQFHAVRDHGLQYTINPRLVCVSRTVLHAACMRRTCSCSPARSYHRD